MARMVKMAGLAPCEVTAQTLNGTDGRCDGDAKQVEVDGSSLDKGLLKEH